MSSTVRGPSNAFAVELAAVHQHLRELQIVLDRRREPAGAGEIHRRELARRRLELAVAPRVHHRDALGACRPVK